MLVIPNLKGSIYTRIWCVYEAYLAYTWKKPIYTVARQHQIWSVGSHDTKVVILVFVYLILFVFHLLQVPCQTMGTYGNVMIRIYFINLHNALAKLADCIQLWHLSWISGASIARWHDPFWDDFSGATLGQVKWPVHVLCKASPNFTEKKISARFNCFPFNCRPFHSVSSFIHAIRLPPSLPPSFPPSLPPSLFLASCMHACNFIPIISFIRSFIHPSIHPFIHSFIHSCIHSIIHLFSLFIFSFRSSLLLFIPSMFHSFILLSTNLLSISHSCVHSVHSFFHFLHRFFSAESFAPEHSWICGFVIISGVLPIHPSPVRSCTSQILQRGAHAQDFPVGHWIYGFQHGLAAPS